LPTAARVVRASQVQDIAVAGIVPVRVTAM
jgi:hypothetical protein